jgi:sugar transferase (PEP-CTERM system associated)
MISKNPAVTGMISLIFGDLLIAAGAFYIGIYLRFGGIEEGLMKYQHIVIRSMSFVFVPILCSFFMELYDQQKNRSRKEILLRSLIAGVFSLIVLSSIYYIIPETKLWRGNLALSLLIFTTAQFVWHATYTIFLRLPTFAKRVLILGIGQKAELMGSMIGATNHNYVLAGYIDCPSEALAVPAYQIVGDRESICETARKERAHKIVISLSEKRGVLPLREIMNCKLSGIDILDAPSFYEEVMGKLFIEDTRPSWFIFSDGFRITALKRVYKRLFDVALSVIGLTIASPLMPVMALLIKVNSPGPVFFRQVRVGEREKNFVLYKFRTMCEDAENDTGAVWAQQKDTRVTGVGNILRKTRFDEIPQLFNVLKGDMSLIGPRPERPEFVEKLKEIIPYYSERHFVKPGITGWAQVKYRYGASVEDAVEKLRYDLYYIKNLSFFLDMLIVLETVKVVLFGRGSR